MEETSKRQSSRDGCGVELRCSWLEEPTNGVDMGAKAAIYRNLAEVARQGCGVLLSSTDEEELCAVCDRVLVMREGRIGATLLRENLTVDRLLGESVRQMRAQVEVLG